MKVTSQDCGKQPDSSVKVEGQITTATLRDDLDQLVGEMTIGLEECAGADPVSGNLCLISQALLAVREENFLLRCRTFSWLMRTECDDSRNLRHRGAQFLRP